MLRSKWRLYLISNFILGLSVPYLRDFILKVLDIYHNQSILYLKKCSFLGAKAPLDFPKLTDLMIYQKVSKL